MERNDDLPGGGGNASGNAGATGGSSGMSAGGTGSNLGGTGGYGDTGDFTGSQGYGAGTGASGSFGAGGSTQSGGEQGLRDRASEALGGARERLADVGSNVKDRAADLGSTVRDKAGTAKNSLADILETGADKLRQRAQGGSVSGTPAYAGDGNASVTTDARVGQMGDRVAGGMQATAEWLRDADLDSMKQGLERQVKEHPGRTLLIALGLGYVLGKAFRK
jgi:hypothetical protein